MTEEEINRNANAAHTLLTQCAHTYLDACRDGRLKEWSAMAHAIVRMLAGEHNNDR